MSARCRVLRTSRFCSSPCHFANDSLSVWGLASATRGLWAPLGSFFSPFRGHRLETFGVYYQRDIRAWHGCCCWCVFELFFNYYSPFLVIRTNQMRPLACGAVSIPVKARSPQILLTDIMMIAGTSWWVPILWEREVSLSSARKSPLQKWPMIQSTVSKIVLKMLRSAYTLPLSLRKACQFHIRHLHHVSRSLRRSEWTRACLYAPGYGRCGDCNSTEFDGRRRGWWKELLGYVLFLRVLLHVSVSSSLTNDHNHRELWTQCFHSGSVLFRWDGFRKSSIMVHGGGYDVSFLFLSKGTLLPFSFGPVHLKTQNSHSSILLS